MQQAEWPNARFCAPDNDVPWKASGLRVVPRLSSLCDGKTMLIYLDGHRAPDCVFELLSQLKCDVIIQGDPLAVRPRNCNLIADKLLSMPDFPWFSPSMDFFATLQECMQRCTGDWRILAPDAASACETCKFLRGHEHAVIAGDLVFDWVNKKLGRVVSPNNVNLGPRCPSTRVELDDGRVVSAKNLNSYLVQTMSNLGSGECDVLVVLPNVSEMFGKMAIRRVRHQVIGLGWHPSVYL